MKCADKRSCARTLYCSRSLSRITNDESAIGIIRRLTDSILKVPEIAFSCGTALSAAYSMLSMLYDTAGLHTLSLRANQHASIFGSFDYQMKGEE